MSNKADRLLITGRMHVPAVDHVVVEGDTGVHLIVFDGVGWMCDCLSFQYRRRCAHVEATRRITAPVPGQWGGSHP